MVEEVLEDCSEVLGADVEGASEEGEERLRAAGCCGREAISLGV